MVESAWEKPAGVAGVAGRRQCEDTRRRDMAHTHAGEKFARVRKISLHTHARTRMRERRTMKRGAPGDGRTRQTL